MRVVEDGQVAGYKITGNKQWISNGGVADLYSVLAKTPGGPSWFIVEKGAPGLSHGKPEDKHGIRASNTAAVSLEDVYVDADRLLGGKEGQGLIQAQLVFGYTRLMVAAFGLGAGWAALDRAIPYSVGRIQAGAPLSEKQGYTHKLIVPHAVLLEAARARISRRPPNGIDRRRQPEYRRAPSPNIWRQRRAISRPMPQSRRWAATATRANTWWKRSSAMRASPEFMKELPKSWR